MTTTKASRIAVVITAAGNSSRIGNGVKKEYLPYRDGTVISACANTFFNALGRDFLLSALVVTCPAGMKAEAAAALEKGLSFPFDRISLVEGGVSRQHSVFNALDFIASKALCPDYVLIHDGARPFVSEALILRTLAAAAEHGAAAPGLSPVDTQKEIDEEGFVVRHLERRLLRAVQTPQAFDFDRLYSCHKKALDLERDFTDDTELYGAFGGRVKLVEGEVQNIKLTYKKDLDAIRAGEGL